MTWKTRMTLKKAYKVGKNGLGWREAISRTYTWSRNCFDPSKPVLSYFASCFWNNASTRFLCAAILRSMCCENDCQFVIIDWNNLRSLCWILFGWLRAPVVIEIQISTNQYRLHLYNGARERSKPRTSHWKPSKAIWFFKFYYFILQVTLFYQSKIQREEGRGEIVRAEKQLNQSANDIFGLKTPTEAARGDAHYNDYANYVLKSGHVVNRRGSILRTFPGLSETPFTSTQWIKPEFDTIS